MKKTFEVERKWVLRRLPDISQIDMVRQEEISQAYVETSEFGLRLRKADSTYFLTSKSPGDMIREEREMVLPEWAYQELLGLAWGEVAKTRYVFSAGGKLIELDAYHNGLEGLVTVEAEWKIKLDVGRSWTEQTCLAMLSDSRPRVFSYQLPVWLGESREVTQDDKYKNVALAKAGKPEIDWDIVDECNTHI